MANSPIPPCRRWRILMNNVQAQQSYSFHWGTGVIWHIKALKNCSRVQREKYLLIISVPRLSVLWDLLLLFHLWGIAVENMIMDHFWWFKWQSTHGTGKICKLNMEHTYKPFFFSPAGLDDNKNLLPVVNSVMCFPLKRPSWEDLYSADPLYLVITVSH